MSFKKYNLDRLFDDLFNPVAILDHALKIVEANRAFAETYGVPLSDLPGLPFCEISKDLATVCGENQKAQPIFQVFKTRTPLRMEDTHQDAMGKLVHVELKAIPLKREDGKVEYVAVILRDITKLRHTEGKLIESPRTFPFFTEMGDHALLTLDADYRISAANSLAASMTGRTPDDLAGHDFRSLLDEGGQQFFQQAVSRPDREAEWQALNRIKLKGAEGKFRECEACISPAGPANDRLSFFVCLRDLSEEMAIGKNLQRTDEFLFNLIESSTDGIIAADMDGTVIIFNKGAEKLVGYKAEEIIGQLNAAQFYPPGVAQEIMRKMRDERFGGKGKLLPTRITGITKGGEPIPINFSGAIIYEDGKEVATVGIFNDLRAIIKAQEELFKSETRFRNLFERVRHGIYFSTREGRFLDCNQAMSEMLEYSSKEAFLEMDILRDLWCNPEDRPAFQRMIEKDGFVKDYEVFFKKQSGEPLNVELTAHVQKDRTGKVLGYQGLVINISERRKLEQQLFQSEKLAAMGRLTAQIAHELNNPIYGVMNCLDLLRSEVPESNKKHRFLEMAYNESTRMSQLLKNMLNFFQPDADVKSEVALNTLIEEVELFVRKQLMQFKIKVALELQPELPPLVASGNQLKQVILNMIMNARNAMPQGGNLTISTHLLNDSVQIRIKDSGIGIPANNLDRIFDAFFTTKRDVKGVGLGLSVCFGIIREHEGKIAVESKEGVGTTFTIILPLKS